MFKCAKHYHDLREDFIPTDDSDIDRAFIRRWKTKIYRFLEQEKNISVGNFDKYEEDEIFKMVMNKFC